jgi:hypothetical protein
MDILYHNRDNVSYLNSLSRAAVSYVDSISHANDFTTPLINLEQILTESLHVVFWPRRTRRQMCTSADKAS